MCGICGMAGISDTALLERMMTALRHRGPDAEGTHVADGVALGHRRLSIIDVEGSPQPLANEDGALHLVANGEIYNYVALREELKAKGHRFHTDGDCETILHLYEEFGDACVERLDGMFAFALWDDRERRLLLGRDRLGIKPLLYREVAGTLVFASELKGVLADRRASAEIDSEALDLYLTFRYVPAPWTMVKGVRKLPPGHTLAWQSGTASLKSYWRLPPTDAIDDGATMADATERVREMLRASVTERLVSDVPLGAYLSGGLDSSLVVGLMSHGARDPVRTFSVGFRESGFDESAEAKRVSDHFGTRHNPLVVERDASFDELPRILWHLDEPVADAAAIPTYQMARLTKEHVTVVLTGEGADELFAGYSHYKFLSWTRGLGRLLWPLAVASPFTRLGKYFGAIADPAEAYLTLKSVFTSDERRALLACGQAGDHARELVAQHVGREVGGDPVAQLLRLDLSLWLPDDLLVKVDRMTMAHAVEARVPFLDHQFVEAVTTLPSRLKLKGATGKALLREVGDGLLPKATQRRRKQGFGVPVDKWLRNHDLLESLLGAEAVERRGLFRPDAVAPLVARHSHTLFSRRQLWTLLSLEMWCRVMLDRDPITPPVGPA